MIELETRLDLPEEIAGRQLEWCTSEELRIGDHRWWISDLDEFRSADPSSAPTYGIAEILCEIYGQNVGSWSAVV